MKYTSVEMVKTIDPFFLFGLANNYFGFIVVMIMSKLYKAHAYILDSMNYDKDNTTNYFALDAQIQKQTFIAEVKKVIYAFRSIMVNHAQLDSFLSIFTMEKNTDGYNSPYIYVNFEIPAIVKQLKVSVQNAAGSANEISLIDFDKLEEINKGFFAIEDITKILNHQPVQIGTDVSRPETYMKKMSDLLSDLTKVINKFSNMNIDYYAALTVIQPTGILDENYATGYDLSKLIAIDTIKKD